MAEEPYGPAGPDTPVPEPPRMETPPRPMAGDRPFARDDRTRAGGGGTERDHRATAADGSHDTEEEGLFGRVRRWVGVLEKAVTETAVPDRVLSYREVVGYLAANYPESPSPVRGALLRRRRSSAWVFRILFLDDAGDPVTDRNTGRLMGYAVVARGCDGELAEMFGNKDLIIFD